jgi:hypothetical protein
MCSMLRSVEKPDGGALAHLCLVHLCATVQREVDCVRKLGHLPKDSVHRFVELCLVEWVAVPDNLLQCATYVTGLARTTHCRTIELLVLEETVGSCESRACTEDLLGAQVSSVSCRLIPTARQGLHASRRGATPHEPHQGFALAPTRR